MLSFFKNKIYLAISLLVTLFLTGILGFHFIANYNWIDAIYMTVITVATVGYGEVLPLSDSAKLFAVFLIITSLGVIAYSLSVITEYIISNSNPKLIQFRKVQKMITSLEDHVIICGYGRNGKQVAKKLKAHNKPFVVIEKREVLVDAHQSVDIPMILGDAIDDNILKKANIYKANCLISALPEDADNLFIVLSARQMNNKLKIISRASKASSYKKLRLAGANNVIMPDRIGGDHMASLVVVPDLIEFLDKLSLVGKGSVNIEEVPSEKFNNEDKNQSIRNLDIRSRTGCTIIGYKNPEGKYTVNPEADQVIEKGSRVVVLGNVKQIETLNSTYDISVDFE